MATIINGLLDELEETKDEKTKVVLTNQIFNSVDYESFSKEHKFLQVIIEKNIELFLINKTVVNPSILISKINKYFFNLNTEMFISIGIYNKNIGEIFISGESEELRIEYNTTTKGFNLSENYFDFIEKNIDAETKKIKIVIS